MSEQPTLDGLSADDLQYLEVQRTLIRIADELSSIDLDRFLNRISRAHSLAPFTDPSLYKLGAATMGAIEDLARAAADFKRCLRQKGVLTHLAIQSFAERQAKPAAAPSKRRGPHGWSRG